MPKVSKTKREKGLKLRLCEKRSMGVCMKKRLTSKRRLSLINPLEKKDNGGADFDLISCFSVRYSNLG